MNIQDTLQRYDQLIAATLTCRKNYYEEGYSTIDDAGYDLLVDEIRDLEMLLPENYHSPKSPTIAVGVDVVAESDLVVELHPEPMLSLQKARTWTDVEKLEKAASRHVRHNELVEYVVERKYDGVALELIFARNDNNEVRLTKALLRGDGIQGECVTQNALAISNIPKTLDVTLARHELFVVRGEVVFTPYEVTLINERMLEAMPKARQYKTPRHLATATMRQLNTATVHERRPTFIAHELVNAHTVFDTHMEAIDFLRELGIDVGEDTVVVRSYEQAITAADRIWRQSNESTGGQCVYEYPIDGVVFKVNNLDIQRAMGATAHHPKWAVAYKYADANVTSHVTGMHYGISRLGMLVPVLTFDPVTINGIVIKQASLANTSELQWQRYHVGKEVNVRLAGMVIPQVSAVFEYILPNTVASPPPVIFTAPTECPFCNHPTETRGTNPYAVCVNTKACSEQIVKRLLYFVGKDCMGFTGFGEVMVRNVVNELKITNPNNLLLLDGDALQTIGLTGRSAFKMINIIASRTALVLDNEPWRYLAGLCVPGVNMETARELMSTYSTVAAIGLRTADTIAATNIIDVETASELLAALQ